jgi:hypothetical protein
MLTLNATNVGKNKDRTSRKAVAVKRAIQESEKSVCLVPANEGFGDFIQLRMPANCRSAL